jgi:hypothetical protein
MDPHTVSLQREALLSVYSWAPGRGPRFLRLSPFLNTNEALPQTDEMYFRRV